MVDLKKLFKANWTEWQDQLYLEEKNTSYLYTSVMILDVYCIFWFRSVVSIFFLWGLKEVNAFEK